jgi:C_GCAxxG_C_C family probable redox protein
MTVEVERIKSMAYELAKRNELEKTGCGQSALGAILEAVGKPNEEVFRAASGLADGLGLSTKGTCGALLGAAMAIGLFFGRGYDKFHDPMAAMDSYDLVLEVVEEFEKRVGAIKCGDIQTSFFGRTFNLRRPEELEAALAAGLHPRCAEVVGTAALLAAGIIAEEM